MAQSERRATEDDHGYMQVCGGNTESVVARSQGRAAMLEAIMAGNMIRADVWWPLQTGDGSRLGRSPLSLSRVDVWTCARCRRRAHGFGPSDRWGGLGMCAGNWQRRGGTGKTQRWDDVTGSGGNRAAAPGLARYSDTPGAGVKRRPPRDARHT